MVNEYKYTISTDNAQDFMILFALTRKLEVLDDMGAQDEYMKSLYILLDGLVDVLHDCDSVSLFAPNLERKLRESADFLSKIETRHK